MHKRISAFKFIIGYTLCDIWYENPYSDVGDIFLFHRLNKLGEEGKLEIIGREEDTDEDVDRSRRILQACTAL